MALNLTPNDQTPSPCASCASSTTQDSTSSHITYLDKISPASSNSHDFGLLSAFQSKIIEMPDIIPPKVPVMYPRFGCGLCDKNYTSRGKLNKHSAECHTVDKNYVCEVCNKRFRLRNSLNIHSLTHTGNKPFQCPDCDKYFTQKSSLNTHKKQFHDVDVKWYECSHCDKRFKLKYFLDMHNLTHNGQKPYKCNICDSRFTQKSSLNTHVKQFHESSVPMFQCMRCDKKFLRESMLDKHIENHP